MKINSVTYKVAEAPTEDFAALIANTGGDAKQIIEFEVDYSFISSQSLPVQVVNGDLVLLGGNWSDLGYIAGESVIIYISDSASTYNSGFVPNEITFINGDTMVLDVPILLTGTTFNENSIFPNGNENPVLQVLTGKAAEAIDFYFNLLPNASQGNVNSYIDGEVNRFLVDGVQLMNVGDTLTVPQLGNKSGGTVYSCELERLSNGFNNVKTYQLTTTFNVYSYFEPNEVGKPTFFLANDSLKPYFELDIQAQFNNPNSVKKLSVSNAQGNIGWFDENFNNGNNPHSIQSLSYTVGGQSVTQIDAAQTTTVEAVINVPNIQETDLFNFTFNYVPQDETYYKNKTLPLENQMMRLSSAVFAMYTHSAGSQGSATGKINADGASIDAQNIFFIVDEIAETLTFRCDLVPQSGFSSFIDSRDTGDRTYELLLSVQGDAPDHNSSDRVQLLVDNNQLINNPVIGGAFAGEVSTEIFEHPQDADTETGAVNAETFKEDDILLQSDFVFDVNDSWESLSARVEAVDGSGNVLFNLEAFNLSFLNSPVLNDGTQEINESISRALGRPFNEPYRDLVSVERLSSLDAGDDRGYRLRYGLLSRWEDYVENNNVTNQFFDANEPFNGKNNDWKRLLDEGASLKISYYVFKNGVGYFVKKNLLISEYDSSPSITTDVTFEDENGNPVTALVNGQNIKVIATHTLAGAEWGGTDVWAWLALRPKEATPIKLISSAYDWTNDALPYRPLQGETRAKITYLSSSVLKVEALFDTNSLQSFNDFTITARIQDNALKNSEDPDVSKAGNCHVQDIKRVSLPTLAIDEDRGVKYCNTPYPVVGSLSETDRLFNDVTGVFVKRSDVLDVVTFTLEKDGQDITPLGNFIGLPYDPLVVAFVIDWRQHLAADGVGCYKLRVDYNIAGIEGSYYKGAYDLQEYAYDIVEDTVRLYTYFDSYHSAEGINFKDSGFTSSIRFNGYFGNRQPNTEIENIKHTDNVQRKIRRENINSYELITDPLSECFTREIVDFHLVGENEIYVTDNDAYNHSYRYRDYPVILSETAEFSHTTGRPSSIKAKFEDKQLNEFSSYSSSLEANVIEPLVCTPATVTNSTGTYTESVPSGGSLELPDINFVVNVNGTLNQTVTLPSQENNTINITA